MTFVGNKEPGDGDFRPDDQEIVGALLAAERWTAQNQLQLARELLERLEIAGSSEPEESLATG